jgi:O-antigen/teichoic acid export membrane protein
LYSPERIWAFRETSTVYWRGILLEFFRRKLEEQGWSKNFILAVKNSGWLSLDCILRSGVGLFVSAFVARYLGPTEFGLLSFATAFVFVFGAIAALGMESVAVREMVRCPAEQEEIVANVFILRLASGFAAFLAAIGLIILLRPGESQTHWLVGISAAGMVFQAFDALTYRFYAQLQAKHVVLAKNISFLLISATKLCLVLVVHAPLIAFAWAGLVEVILGCVGLVIIYRQNVVHVSWRWNSERSQRLAKDSWPLVISGIALFVQARIDQLMLAEMAGMGGLGQYSAALRLVEGVSILAIIIKNSVFPSIIRARSTNAEIYFERLLNMYRCMMILFLLVAVPVMLFARPIVALVYGDKYREAGVLLPIMMLRLFFTYFGVARGIFITNENMFRYSLITTISGVLVNILLNCVLVPKFGGMGAVWSMVVSFAVTGFIVDIFNRSARTNLLLMLKGIITPWKMSLGRTNNIQ